MSTRHTRLFRICDVSLKRNIGWKANTPPPPLLLLIRLRSIKFSGYLYFTEIPLVSVILRIICQVLGERINEQETGG